MFKIPKVSIVSERVVELENRNINSPSKAVELLRLLVTEKDKEHFLLLMLSARQRAIGVHLVSLGTLSASLVHPREVFRPAVVAGAAGIIVAHNHPSGDVLPSSEDKETTRRLTRTAEIMGIPLLDHIVFTDNAMFSFKEHGLLS